MRFRRFLEQQKIWTSALEERLMSEVTAEINEAVRTAEATPRPALETIFTDVYAALPPHLRAQGEAAFDLARRKGDAAAGDGKFPL